PRLCRVGACDVHRQLCRTGSFPVVHLACRVFSSRLLLLSVYTGKVMIRRGIEPELIPVFGERSGGISPQTNIYNHRVAVGVYDKIAHIIVIMALSVM